MKSALLYLFAFCLLPLFLSAQIENPKRIFREMKALEGTWYMPTDRGDRLEIWSVEDDSTLVGRGLRIRIENGDTVKLETMRIEWRDTNITYYATVRGQNDNKPVAFQLTDADPYEGYLFENPKHDDPQKIRYLLLGNRELQVKTEGKRAGSNRPTITEYVFEREFAPGSMEFRLRAGVNAFTLRGTGNFVADPDPAYDVRPGWELGTAVRFKGRGGFLTLNFELGLVGKFSHVKSAFFNPEDTLDYVRNGTYGQTWLVVAFTPELNFSREGRLSVLAGPYYGLLIGNRLHGTEEPSGENKLFNANKDFKRSDIGLLAGLNYRLNFGKKDLGGILGIRANLGLANLDNLYDRGCDNPAYCNGRVSLHGLSVYYSVNLLKL